jgi:hypothetical protein
MRKPGNGMTTRTTIGISGTETDKKSTCERNNPGFETIPAKIFIGKEAMT